MRSPSWILFCGLLPTVVAGCGDRSCLRGDEGCRVVSPCHVLAATCASDPLLEVRVLDGSEAAWPGAGHRATLAGKGDVVLRNGQIEVAISGLGNQNYLDVAGGSILDLRVRDATTGPGGDAIDEITTAVGILPEDEPQYDALEILDERPARVAVQLRGHLYKHPDKQLFTLYELRPCDRFVRVRSEAVNRTPDPQLWSLSDAFYWSNRSSAPFTPTDGGGFHFDDFGLLTIDDAYFDTPFVASTSPTGPETGYASVSCSQSQLNGFPSGVVSTAGLPQTVVTPRGYLVFERAIAVTAGAGASHAIDEAFELRGKLWGDPWVTIAGRVTQPTGVRGPTDLALLIVEKHDGKTRPWTHIQPEPSGRFSARVPAGKALTLAAYRFGQAMPVEITLGSLTADKDLGDVAIAAFVPPTHIAVSVADAAAQPLPAELYVVPRDATTRDQTTGTFFSQYPACAPYLGVYPAGSPSCAMVLVPPAGNVEFDLPDGKYDLYAFHGPFFSLARQSLDAAGQPATLSFTLRDLGLHPGGALSADLHVHGAASFDSSIPDEDRVLAFVASDTDVLVATDHDVAYDYSAVAHALGVDAQLVTVAGVETTGHVPYLKVPGDAFPRVIGHYNFWPIAYRPGQPRNGAPFDEFIEPGELFDRLLPLASSTVPIFQLNHPWLAAEFGRDLGFPRALHLDLREHLPASDDGTRGGMFVRNHNDAHHTQEVMNGSANEGLIEDRTFWFYMLDEGRPRTGTANSDTHALGDNTAGSPRNLVYSTTQKAGFAIDVFNQALRDGKVLGTNGPLIDAVIRDGASELGYGMQALTVHDGAMLHVEVRAAPWVVVDEVRVIVNGEVKKTIGGTQLVVPSDPFGTTELERFVGDVPLSELLSGVTGDAWIVVEAGSSLPLFADLGGGLTGNAKDGVPDTGDNNHDGVVDERDIAEGEDIGPLAGLPEPPEGDVRRHFYRVMHGGYPFAFTNPFLLDRDGNGHFDGRAR